MTLPTNYTDTTTPTGASSELPATTSRGINAINTQINSNTARVFNVKDYGAKGDNTTDDTTHLQAAIDAAGTNGGIVFFPPGAYKISAALNLGSNSHNYVVLQGSGSGADFGNPNDSRTAIRQTSTTANGVSIVDGIGVIIRDIEITGPGSGSGVGVLLDYSVNGNVNGTQLSNVIINRWGSHGFSGHVLVMCTFNKVFAQYCGGDGFYIYGGGTSCCFDSCWAASCSGNGWHVDNMAYCSWQACGADVNGNGWLLANSKCLTLNGCGTESNTTDCITLNANWLITLNSFYIYDNRHYGLHCLNNNYMTIVNGLWEVSGTGAVYSIYVESGCETLINYNATQTATNFAGPVSTFQWGALNCGAVTVLGKPVLTVGATTAAAPTATSGTGQTQLASYQIPASSVSAGSSFKIKVFGTQSTTSGTLTYQIHCGTANTTADTVITSAAPAVAASGGASFEGMLTVRTIGASGTCIAEGRGLGTAVVNSSTATTSAINTTVANYLTVSVAASAGTHTAQIAYVSVAQA